MRFVGNYALCGLSPQTDGMPVILRKGFGMFAKPFVICKIELTVSGARVTAR